MHGCGDERGDADPHGTAPVLDGLQGVGSLHVSLRGSLAVNVARLREEGMLDAADTYIRNLMISTDPALLRLTDGEMLIIGLASEREQFPPDW